MYYLIEITTKADKVEKGIYSYNNRIDAVATFHQKIGGAMKNKDYLEETVMLITATGSVEMHEYYKKPEE